MRARAALTVWHRWFGLVGGVWLLMLALSGCLLVFYEEIDRALNRDLWEVPRAGSALPLSAVAGAAEARYPGTYASSIDLPNEPGRPAIVYLSARAGSAVLIPSGLHLFIDPDRGLVLGERVFGAFRLDRRHFAHFLYQLHMDLHLGDRARWLLGLLALLWVVDHGVAAVLSFPKPRRWMESFRIRKGARGYPLIYGLHRAGGLWLLAITLTLAVSGIYFNWYDHFRGAVSRFSPVEKRYYEVAPSLPAPLYQAPVTLDQAAAIARAWTGGAPVDAISPLPGQGLYWIRLFDRRDLDPYGSRWIYVDMVSGAIRSDAHPMSGTVGDQFIAWQYPLHSGKAFGWPGRLLIFFSGLAVSGFVITGYWIWWRKRAARCAANRQLQWPPAALPLDLLPAERGVSERTV